MKEYKKTSTTMKKIQPQPDDRGKR